MSIFEDPFIGFLVTEWDEESFFNLLLVNKTICQNLLPFKSQHLSRFPWYKITAVFVNPSHLPKLDKTKYGIEGMSSIFFKMSRQFFPDIPIDPLYAQLQESGDLNNINLDWLNLEGASSFKLLTKFCSASDNQVVPLLTINFTFWREPHITVQIFYWLEQTDTTSIYAKIGPHTFKVATNLPQFLSDLHMFHHIFVRFWSLNSEQKEYKENLLSIWPRNEYSYMYGFCARCGEKSKYKTDPYMLINGCKICPNVLFCDGCCEDARRNEEHPVEHFSPYQFQTDWLHEHRIELIDLSRCSICRSVHRQVFGKIFVCEKFHRYGYQNKHRKHLICFDCRLAGHDRIEECICDYDAELFDQSHTHFKNRYCDVCLTDIEYSRFSISRTCAAPGCKSDTQCYDQCDKCLDLYKSAKFIVKSHPISSLKDNRCLSKKQRKAKAKRREQLHNAKAIIRRMESHQKRTGHQGWATMLEPVLCSQCTTDCSDDFWICNGKFHCYACLRISQTLSPESNNKIVRIVNQKATQFCLSMPLLN